LNKNKLRSRKVLWKRLKLKPKKLSRKKRLKRKRSKNCVKLDSKECKHFKLEVECR
jgi:hypothetical protein